MTLLIWLIFLLGPWLWLSQACSFGLFLSSDPNIFSTMAFPSLVNSYNVVVSASINFLSNSRQDATFYWIAYDNSSADWDSLHDHLRDVPCEDTFKLSSPAAASEFCECSGWNWCICPSS